MTQKVLQIIAWLFISTSISQAQDLNKQDLLSLIGNSSAWNNLNYVLFTSNSTNSIFKDHSCLVEKNTGRVRFEGKTNKNVELVILFNYKSKTLEKSYINGKLVENKTSIPFQEVLNLFTEDSQVLFLPMYIISTRNNNISISSEKIINSEKLFVINFKNIQTLNKQILNGSIFINKKGEIKEYQIDKNIYYVSDRKDIGEGIILPTKFINKSTPSLNIKFNTVAAFTDVEDNKFTNY